METTLSLETIPPQVRESLAERARKQTVERYKLPPSVFDEAEALVNGGKVSLTGQAQGLVYDAGDWAMVTLRDCGHCYHKQALGTPGSPGGVCRHRVAIAFADLLARHAPGGGNDRNKPVQARRGAGQVRGTGAFGLGRAGGYSARTLRRGRARTRGRDHRHCPKCGGWLTAEGGCNLCGG